MTGRGLAVLVVVGAAGSPAHAQESKPPPTLVFESHVGPRSPETAKFMARLGEALEAQGFAARPATILKMARVHVPRPGVQDADQSARAIGRLINEGLDRFVSADFAEATTKLTAGIAAVHRNPALVVIDTGNLELMFRAHVALAVSQQRSNDTTAAFGTMREVIRMFPTRPVGRGDVWGPEGERLYRTVYKQIQDAKRGRLSVSARHPDAAIFIEGQLRGIGNASVADLIPGLYRVLVRAPNTQGRHYAIQVAASADTHLNVADVDAVLWASDDWVGFRFDADDDRAGEAKLANDLSRRWTGNHHVVVLDVGTRDQRASVIGTLYRGGVHQRRAQIVADGSDPEAMRSLARFLADGTPGAGIDVLEAAKPAGVASAAASSERSEGAPAWHRPRAFMIGGGAVVVAAAVVFAFDEDPSRDGPEFIRNTAPYAIGMAVVGAAAIGVGIWQWRRGARRTQSQPVAAIAPGHAWVGWAGRF